MTPISPLYLNLRYVAAKKTSWCEAGHVLGWDQIELPAPKRKIPARMMRRVVSEPPFEIKRDSDKLVLTNDRLSASVSNETGIIESLQWRGEDVLISGPELQVWRGPTDNDGIKGWTGQHGKPLGRWLEQGLDQLTLKTVAVKTQPEPGRQRHSRHRAHRLLHREQGRRPSPADFRHQCRWLASG